MFPEHTAEIGIIVISYQKCDLCQIYPALSHIFFRLLEPTVRNVQDQVLSHLLSENPGEIRAFHMIALCQ